MIFFLYTDSCYSESTKQMAMSNVFQIFLWIKKKISLKSVKKLLINDNNFLKKCKFTQYTLIGIFFKLHQFWWFTVHLLTGFRSQFCVINKTNDEKPLAANTLLGQNHLTPSLEIIRMMFKCKITFLLYSKKYRYRFLKEKRLIRSSYTRRGETWLIF